LRSTAVRSLCLVAVASAFLGQMIAPAARATTAIPPCKDGAYTLNGTHWNKTLLWRFQAGSTPANLKAPAVERRLKQAARSVATGRNRCGLTSDLSAHQRYAGRTKAKPNIRRNGSCGTPDGHNEVGFGTLPSAEMGLTCYWSQGDATIEADILFNRADYRWITKVASGCVVAWDIQAVATHEFGHAFGLGHVGEGLHANLTMAPYILPCQNSESRLGLGDLRGL